MWLRIILGGLYVAMAAGQLASWSRMPSILAAYHAVPTAGLPWLAAALVAGELVGGLWLLARSRSRSLAPVWLYTAIAGVWAALGLQAQLRGLPVANCGCFGVYLTQRLSWFVLAQDALLLFYAALMIREARRDPDRSRRAPLPATEVAETRWRICDARRTIMTVRAVWNGQVIAESDNTVTVEGNHYFPAESLRREYFIESGTRTVCPWKGLASYYTVTVDGTTNPDAAWFYPHPTPLARKVKDRVAFWRGVDVHVVADRAQG